MKRTISLGKIDFYKTGRKINEVTIDIELRDEGKGEVLSVSGDVWNIRHSDIVYGGQCLDGIYGYFKHHKTFKEIHRLWKAYHLNDTHAGTERQEEILDSYRASHGIGYFDYDLRCKVLEENGLLEDTLEDGTKYRYGTAWLFRPIPEEELQIIRKIIETGEA